MKTYAQLEFFQNGNLMNVVVRHLPPDATAEDREAVISHARSIVADIFDSIADTTVTIIDTDGRMEAAK